MHCNTSREFEFGCRTFHCLPHAICSYLRHSAVIWAFVIVPTRAPNHPAPIWLDDRTTLQYQRTDMLSCGTEPPESSCWSDCYELQFWQKLNRLAQSLSIFADTLLEVALVSKPICALVVIDPTLDDAEAARVGTGGARVDAGGPRFGPKFPPPNSTFTFLGGVDTAVYSQYRSAAFCTNMYRAHQLRHRRYH